MWSQINLQIIGLVLVVLSAGCVSPGTIGDRTSSTSTPQSAGTEAGVVADKNKKVQLLNEWNQSVDLQLRIVRLDTDETVHDENYTLSPDSSQTAYTINRADTSGIEAFEVIVTARNRTTNDRFANDACYGNIHVPINSDGTFEGALYGSIC